MARSIRVFRFCGIHFGSLHWRLGRTGRRPHFGLPHGQIWPPRSGTGPARLQLAFGHAGYIHFVAGMFAFNGGSQLALGTLEDSIAVSTIFINTNMAAAGGVVAAMAATQILYKKVDLTMALNGAIGGLVSITAEPLAPSIPMAVMIGAIGGISGRDLCAFVRSASD